MKASDQKKIVCTCQQVQDNMIGGAQDCPQVAVSPVRCAKPLIRSQCSQYNILKVKIPSCSRGRFKSHVLPQLVVPGGCNSDD